MDGEAEKKKWGDFYDRLRKEYKEGSKPFVYELDLASAKPKPRAGKFIIVIKKFISMYKDGIKELYDNEEDHRDNYWSELNRHFHEDYEMGFVNNTYWEQPKHKIKKYFALLIHTKRIFEVITFMVEKADYLYIDPEEKKQSLQKQMADLDFLKDGQYTIMGDIITKYEEYSDNRAMEEKVRDQQRKKEEERLRKMEEQIKAQELIEKQKKEEAEARERENEAKRQQALKKLAEVSNQKDPREEAVITSDYFPEQYKAFTQDEKVLRKNSSSHKLEIPHKKNGYGHKEKNSQKLFRERYKDEAEVFSYALKPEFSEDKTVCAACQKDLKTGLYMVGGNQNFCYYTGKWYCNEDISQERFPIPWKAMEEFDLRGYTVCKKAHAEIRSYMDKPIIEIKNDSSIVKKSKRLYDFLVIKRQIHLIYDSICNLDLIEPLLRDKLNYCLKNNLFSLKNLYDIYNGQETMRMQREYEILSRHFYRCEVCQKKKGYNCPVCKDPVKIFPFELKETLGCKACRKLYHRKCLPSGKCLCQQDE